MNFQKNIRNAGILAAGIILLFSSCKEQPPYINFSQPVKPLKDTSYVSTTVPAAQTKRVLLFDLTGVRCPNCPTATAVAKKIRDTLYPGKVTAVNLYITSLALLTTPWPGYDTLTTQAAELMMQNLEVPGSIPKGCVDQMQYNGTRMLEHTDWITRVNSRLAESTPVNIDLSSSYDAGKREAVISFKSVFTAEKTATHKIVIAITEDSIIGKQSTPTGKEDHYEHEHVLRTTLTDPTGNIIAAAIVPGLTIEKEFRYPVPAKWKANHCHVVAWIYDSATKEVYQVKETSLAP